MVGGEAGDNLPPRPLVIVYGIMLYDIGSPRILLILTLDKAPQEEIPGSRGTSWTSSWRARNGTEDVAKRKRPVKPGHPHAFSFGMPVRGLIYYTSE